MCKVPLYGAGCWMRCRPIFAEMCADRATGQGRERQQVTSPEVVGQSYGAPSALRNLLQNPGRESDAEARRAKTVHGYLS